jgi:hypothetical protein
LHSLWIVLPPFPYYSTYIQYVDINNYPAEVSALVMM